MRTIVQLSDIHFGATDPVAVEALRRDLLARPYDLLIVSGDFTQRARSSQFREAMAFLDPLPGPKLFVPGNHDVPLWNAAQRFGKPLGKYRKHVTRDLTPVFRDEQLLVMGINTARPLSWSWGGFWKDGRISSRQLEKVRQTFAGEPDALLKILVTHHPFLPPPERPEAGVLLADESDETELAGPSSEPGRDLKYKRRIVHRSRRALRTLESVGVELLLAGHLHLNYSGDVRLHHESVDRGILSVQAGTATSHRRRGEPNAYNQLIVETPDVDGVEAERITVQVRQCEHDTFADGPRTVHAKQKNGWARQPTGE